MDVLRPIELTEFVPVNRIVWIAWGFAFAVHVLGLLWIIMHPKSVVLYDPALETVVRIVLLPSAPKSDTKLAPVVKPTAIKTSEPVVKKKAAPKPLVEKPKSQPHEAVSKPNTMPKPDEPVQALAARKKAAAALLFLPKHNPKNPATTAGFLAAMACRDLKNQQPKCIAYRATLGDVEFAYGRGTMRDGVVLGAEYRLMDPEELEKAFGIAPRYDGPSTPLADTSMNPVAASSDEMRDRLAHWPPDPVFGD